MKFKVLLIIILIVVINISFLSINKVQADGLSDVIKGGDKFLEAGKDQEISIDKTELQNASKTVYNILLLAGMCIAVIISGILGIQFMIGSTEEKAQIKESMVPFIIGCIVVFGAFGIWKIFITIGNNF